MNLVSLWTNVCEMFKVFFRHNKTTCKTLTWGCQLESSRIASWLWLREINVRNEERTRFLNRVHYKLNENLFLFILWVFPFPWNCNLIILIKCYLISFCVCFFFCCSKKLLLNGEFFFLPNSYLLLLIIRTYVEKKCYFKYIFASGFVSFIFFY